VLLKSPYFPKYFKSRSDIRLLVGYWSYFIFNPGQMGSFHNNALITKSNFRKPRTAKRSVHPRNRWFVPRNRVRSGTQCVGWQTQKYLGHQLLTVPQRNAICDESCTTSIHHHLQDDFPIPQTRPRGQIILLLPGSQKMAPHASSCCHRHVKTLLQDYETISKLEQKAASSRVILLQIHHL
jgi:hypothetical protein